jgi:hypothetical protein
MFSDATLIETLNLIEPQYKTRIVNFFMKYSMPNKLLLDRYSKQQIINNVATYVISNPDLKGIFGNPLRFELVEMIINEQINYDGFDEIDNKFIFSDILFRLLKIDGYTISDGMLVKEVNSVVDIYEGRNLIDLLLEKNNFSIAKGHLQQAISAYTRGDWAASNGQLRTYVEELTKRIAEEITGKTFSKSHLARIELSKVNPAIFNKDLNEWGDNGECGYFNGFWKRLHPEGSHPGLSDEDDCSFRLNLVLISTAEILRRFDTFYI